MTFIPPTLNVNTAVPSATDTVSMTSPSSVVTRVQEFVAHLPRGGTNVTETKKRVVNTIREEQSGASIPQKQQQDRRFSRHD